MSDIRIRRVIIDLDCGSVSVELYPIIEPLGMKVELIYQQGIEESLLAWAQSIRATTKGAR